MMRFSKDHPAYHQLLYDIRSNDARLRSPGGRGASAAENRRRYMRLEQERDLLRSQLKCWDALDLLLKYDPNQPRVPTGNSDGGQWTDTGGSGSGYGRARLARQRQDTYQTAIDPMTTAAGTTSTNWLRSAERTWRTIEREFPAIAAFRRLNPIISTTTALLSALKAPELEYPLGEALRQYNAIAAEDDADAIPILSLRAKQFIRDEDKATGKFWASVKEVDKETIKQFCPEYLNIQSLADRVAFSMGPTSLYGSPQNYGNQYHLRAAAEVLRIWRGRLRPELFLMAPMEGMPDEYYARDEIPARAKDTLGLDVIEPVDDETACIYDFKTGAKGLGPKRISDFAFSSAKSKEFMNIKQFFIIEIRPSRGAIIRN